MDGRIDGWMDGLNAHMKMVLAMLPRIFNALFQDLLGLLDELAVEVDSVLGDAAGRVVLPEDVLARLPVVLLHLGRVPLALVAELFRRGAVAALVRLVRLHGWGLDC